MDNLDNFTKEELINLIKVYAKNWLAHDGCWFLAVEEKFGLETAIELDKKSWERFAQVEAKRIMREFQIPENSGLDGLEKAFHYRLYAYINKQEIIKADGKLIFKMIECRVQQTRSEKKLPLFPCKEVGLVEFTNFAKTIDNRIKTRCISCPPDDVKDSYCIWEFWIDDK